MHRKRQVQLHIGVELAHALREHLAALADEGELLGEDVAALL